MYTDTILLAINYLLENEGYDCLEISNELEEQAETFFKMKEKYSDFNEFTNDFAEEGYSIEWWFDLCEDTRENELTLAYHYVLECPPEFRVIVWWISIQKK